MVPPTKAAAKQADIQSKLFVMDKEVECSGQSAEAARVLFCPKRRVFVSVDFLCINVNERIHVNWKYQQHVRAVVPKSSGTLCKGTFCLYWSWYLIIYSVTTLFLYYETIVTPWFSFPSQSGFPKQSADYFSWFCLVLSLTFILGLFWPSVFAYQS